MSTTLDPPRTDSFLLRVRLTKDGWLVTDSATTRYGLGDDLETALVEWQNAIRDLTELREPLGLPIAAEAEWAREVLKP